MTIWTPDIDTHPGPRYEAIADAVAAATNDGTLAPGDRLPPQRELAFRLGVTVGTVSRGYTLAEQRGLVRGEIGRGTFVRDRSDGQAMLPAEALPYVDLSMNVPLGRANAAALAATLGDIATGSDALNLLRYMPTAGHAAHRAAAAQWIARSGFDVAAERIVLTEGAQQGLAAIFDVLVAPGESVLVEDLTYSGLIENARMKGIRLEGVAMDAEGMLPDALESKARTTSARVVVVVPTIQNPTAAVMSAARREAIAEVAARHGLTVVEDDVYGYLLTDRPPPIAALLPAQTVYITSASKCLAPGLRVGWIVSPERHRQRFVDLVYAQSVAQPALNHEIVRRWIEDGTAVRLVAELARETAARHSLAVDVLGGHPLRGHPASFHVLLELPPPWRRDEFIGRALEHDIRISSIGSFAVDPDGAGESVRISLVGAEDLAALERALGSLRDLIAGGARASRTVV